MAQFNRPHICELWCKTRFSLITIPVQYYLDDIARINDCTKRKFIIVYADDILLIAQSVSELEILLKACEKELLFSRHGHQRKEIVLLADRTALQCGLR